MSKTGDRGREIAKVIGKAIFYSSIQASWGSVEMSSKYSVLNFSKDQETLQRAANALRSYFVIGVIWTAGTILALYASHGMLGAIAGIISNIVMMGWIILSYQDAFKKAAKDNKLQTPTVFKEGDWTLAGIAAVVTAALLYVFRPKVRGPELQNA